MNQLFTNASAWIWLSNAPEQNCYVQFRQPFMVQSQEPAQLLISAEGHYCIYVNGTYYPSTQYPDFSHYKSVQTIVIEFSAFQEENELTIQVRYPGVDTSVSRKELPGLRFELRQGDKVLAASGSKTLCSHMSGYRSQGIKNITPQLGAGFVYETPGPAVWGQAVCVDKPCTTVPRPIPELVLAGRKTARLHSQGVFTTHLSGLQQYAGLHFRERETMTSEPVTTLPQEKGVYFTCEDGDGIYLILDLGEQTVGYLELDLVCPENARVDVGYGEHLEDLRLRTDVGGRHFTLQWDAPRERHCFTHRFHRIGGRYLQLFIHSHHAVVYYAGVIPVNYPFLHDGEFHCSDHLHQRIYEVAKHTLCCCLHEHYEDCPWREQALYAFDSRNQMLFGYYAFGEFTQPRENLRLLALSQREDGLLEMCAPARISVNIPSFSLTFIVALEEYCRYSGDIAFGEEMRPVVERILEAMNHRVRDGLMWNFREPQYWNFYEWRPLLEGTPIERTEEIDPSAEAALQLYLLLAMKRWALVLGYLGKSDPSLDKQIASLQLGFEQYWDTEEGAYASFLRVGEKIQYAELIQALALYANVVPETRCKTLRAKLAAGTLVPISMSCSIFKYDALLQEPEKYAEAVLEELAQRWGVMLYHGATSFWETDLGAEDFDRAGSLCHAWSSVPIYIYGAYVLGIRPIQPGVWVQHKPVLGGICWAKSTLYPPGGPTEVSVRSAR